MLALLATAPSSREPIKLANPSATIIRFTVGLFLIQSLHPVLGYGVNGSFHFGKRLDYRTRLVDFASSALFNCLGQYGLDSAQLPQFLINLA